MTNAYLVSRAWYGLQLLTDGTIFMHIRIQVAVFLSVDFRLFRLGSYGRLGDVCRLLHRARRAKQYDFRLPGRRERFMHRRFELQGRLPAELRHERRNGRTETIAVGFFPHSLFAWQID